MRRLLLAWILLLAAPLASAQSPAADWRTIETMHFRVHFPSEFRAWAERATASLEAVHDEVAAYVGYAPKQTIDVVIADPQADANGAAFPYLDRPYVVLWAFPPDVESGLGDFTDWIDLVAVHEVAHVLHLTRPRNKPGLLARLLPLPLGPIPLAAPRWVTEGYATVVEGALTGSGRPNSSFRAMVLRRFAIEGKLPSFGALSGVSGWLGGSMAYLVGSSYLEWLEAKEAEGSLRRLWKRMTSRRAEDFSASFRAVFGRSPSDLYDRFRAEVTAQAIAEEKRREAAGLVEGELWQRLEGATLSPQVSPDAKRLLVLRAPKRGRGRLAVWTIAESEEELRADEKRREREAELAKDPEEVVAKREGPRLREPRWTLPAWNGQAPQDPRWMPDGRRVLFARRVPDADGRRRLDLWTWDVDGREVARATRLADVSDADPFPDGKSAVAVRNRFGVSELVRVDLTTGEVVAIPLGDAPTDAWRVWSHPRVSPDGRSIVALLHETAAWSLVVLPAAGGALRRVACCAVGAPAWSGDGTRVWFGSDASGVWEIASVDAEGRETPETATRVTGGAFDPAPAPEDALFFLQMTAKGVDVRRLALAGEPPTPLSRAATDFPILPPPSLAPHTFARAELPASRPYDALASQTLRVASGFTAGPSGESYQSGVEGADVLGRFGWQALGAFGDAAGPRGGSLAAAWRGFPTALALQLFSSLEKPGSQRLFRPAEQDQERRGFFLGADWSRPFDGGRVAVEGGGGWTRVEALSAHDTFSRALGSARAEAELRRTGARYGFAASVAADGSFGNTAGGTWRQFAVGARLTGIASFARLSLSGRYGDTGGDPTRFDVFRVGGAESAIQPPGLDRNRLESPALPAALQTGSRLETYRAELAFAPIPLVLYAERLRAFDPSAPRPDWVRVEGAELRLEQLVPAELLPKGFALYVGVGRVRSDAPALRTTQGYGGLVYRP